MENPILFFDGYCPLCSGIIRILIKLDKSKRLRYSTLNSKTFQKYIRINYLNAGLDTIMLLYGNELFIRSDAVIKLIKILGGLWLLLAPIKFIPKSLRDRIYDYIAKNRSNWFGINDNCYLPTEQEKILFLD